MSASSKSFFRLDPEYGPRSYDKSNKVGLPNSQAEPVKDNADTHLCDVVSRSTAPTQLSNTTVSDSKNSIDFTIETRTELNG